MGLGLGLGLGQYLYEGADDDGEMKSRVSGLEQVNTSLVS